MQRENEHIRGRWTAAALLPLAPILFWAVYLLASACMTPAERRAARDAADVAPDACDLLAPEVPPQVCKKARDAADLLDKLLSGKRAAAARPAVSR
jgi:hypothetical protein